MKHLPRHLGITNTIQLFKRSHVAQSRNRSDDKSNRYLCSQAGHQDAKELDPKTSI